MYQKKRESAVFDSIKVYLLVFKKKKRAQKRPAQHRYLRSFGCSILLLTCDTQGIHENKNKKRKIGTIEVFRKISSQTNQYNANNVDIVTYLCFLT